MNMFKNPVIPGFYPDPSVCRVGKDYYLVTSSFEYFPGVPLFHSRDLVNWRQIGHCLTRESQLPLQGAKPSGGIYAPTIRHHDGRFYMVTTNTTHGGNFFVWTDDIHGEWSEPIWLDQPGIDPSLLFDNDGAVYLTSNGCTQCVIDIETGKRVTDHRKIWDGTGGGYLEAPHLYHIGDWYYLMVAEGGTGRGHMVTLARSKSPWGSFEPCPHNPILSNRGCSGNAVQAVGHGDLIQAHDGNWWMAFLAIREKPGMFPRVHNLGRETFLAPVEWTENGWPIVNPPRAESPPDHQPGTVSIVTGADCLSPHPWPDEPTRDDFDGPLGKQWVSLRNPAPETRSLTDSPGYLTLRGQDQTLDDIDSRTFMGRRQQHDTCTVAALVEFNPESDDDEAGLIVYMNALHHYEIGVTSRDGSRVAVVRRRIGGMRDEYVGPTISGDIVLEVHAEPDLYTFGIRRADGTFETILSGETRYLSTEVAGGFTGVMFAMYSVGEATAKFDWFDYELVEG
jgi:xylan 1,4-beta-xylosidase